jgi:NAD(P)-dependent dehydrogenase (short-subunit alcohol dehydrogenase family)
MGKSWLDGKTALVTGAARRLGRSIAEGLASEGANVIIHYRSSQAEAEEVVASLQQMGVKAWPIEADLALPETAEQLLPRSTELAGPVHVLVNSASIFDPSTLADVTFKAVMRNAAVNAWGPFALMRDLARQDIAEGSILNLLDTRIEGFDRRHIAYILSKHLLHEFGRIGAVEYAPRITVNAVAPGLILPPPGQDDSYLDAQAGALPLQRHGSAQDIVDSALYLIKARFVTGQVIYVDGGRHLRSE